MVYVNNLKIKLYFFNLIDITFMGMILLRWKLNEGKMVMNKNAKRIIIGASVAAGAVAVASAVSYAVTHLLVKVALERDGAKRIENVGYAKKQLRGFEENEEFTEEIRLAAERLEAKELETVKITASDGIQLIGHWYPAQEPKRIIIAMHGWRSGWSNDFGSIADFWHNSGCSILFVEQRGQGRSGGDYMGFGLIERYDCASWAKWINEQKSSTLPIYLAGVSMGAATVMMAANLEMPQNVHGIIADCGFTSPHAIWKHVANNNLHLVYGVIGRIADDLCKRRIQMGSKDFSTVEALSRSDIPIIFIHGTDDHFVPVEMTYENYKAASAPKRLLVVPGADHGMSYFTDAAEYESALKKFWNDFD